MRKNIIKLAATFFDDGYKNIGLINPAITFVLSICKFLEVDFAGLKNLSYGWVLLPLLIWVIMAYVSRWKKYELLEKQLETSFDWNIDKHFTPKLGKNEEACLLHITNGHKKLENCQIELSKGVTRHFVCESFNLRPGDKKIIPIFELLNSSFVLPCNPKGFTEEDKVSWIINGTDGYFQIRLLADNIAAHTLEVNLLRDEKTNKWIIASPGVVA